MELQEKSGFGPRFYRNKMGEGRFSSFVVTFKDSDLWIGIDNESFCPSMVNFAREELIKLRLSLEEYIKHFPLFEKSYSPVNAIGHSPEIAIEMCEAGKIAGTGPMAAVAGAFSEYIGKALQGKYHINEIVVENGGDIYMKLNKDLILSVYAGDSALSGQIGIRIPSSFTPIGVCTSAGKVGPSVSFGKAEAVMVACKNAAVSDALATELGNRIKCGDDIQPVIKQAKEFEQILSLLIICENKIGISGHFELLPIA